MKEVNDMKGYWNHKTGYYIGWTGESWKEFVSPKDYEEWYKENIGD